MIHVQESCFGMYIYVIHNIVQCCGGYTDMLCRVPLQNQPLDPGSYLNGKSDQPK